MTAGTFGVSSVNFTLSARKEVILSAGAFQSPQLLMVSGIGLCADLAKFNISCVYDLPGVGQNMWDHPIFGVARVGNRGVGNLRLIGLVGLGPASRVLPARS
jgi:choline dehydrogenase